MRRIASTLQGVAGKSHTNSWHPVCEGLLSFYPWEHPMSHHLAGPVWQLPSGNSPDWLLSCYTPSTFPPVHSLFSEMLSP
jgi:hypothetical protein